MEEIKLTTKFDEAMLPEITQKAENVMEELKRTSGIAVDENGGREKRSITLGKPIATDFTGMFAGAMAFNGDLSRWNLSGMEYAPKYTFVAEPDPITIYKDVVDGDKATFPKDFFKGLVKPKFHDFLGAWTQPKQEAKADAEFQDLFCDVYQRFDGYSGARYATRCIVMGANSMDGIFRTDVSPQDAAFAFPVLYAMRHCGFKSTKESMTVLKDLYDMLVADYDGSIELFERHAANIKEAASKRLVCWHDNDELITAFLAILEYGDVDDFYNHPLWSETFRITDDKILYTVIMDKKLKRRFTACNPIRTPL